MARAFPRSRACGGNSRYIGKRRHAALQKLYIMKPTSPLHILAATCIVIASSLSSGCTTTERDAYRIGVQYDQFRSDAIVRQFGPAIHLKIHPTRNTILVEDQATATALPQLATGVALSATGGALQSAPLVGVGQYNAMAAGAGSGANPGAVATAAVSYFFGETGCVVSEPAAYYQPWWEITFACPPDFDFRSAVSDQRDSLRRSVPLRRPGISL